MNPIPVSDTDGLDELRKWIALIGASPAGLSEKLGGSTPDLEPDSGYGQLSGLEEWSNDTGLFYFKDGRLFLIHLYSDALLQSLDGNKLLVSLGAPAADLDSRAGKGFTQTVYPDQGVAFASNSYGEVAFVEIFQPMSLDDYIAQIYIDPGPLVR